MAKRNGAGLAILNRDETPQDRFADLVINNEIGPAIRAVVDRL
jgi:NAD-dependent SIR2 family protein deacetylase